MFGVKLRLDAALKISRLRRMKSRWSIINNMVERIFINTLLKPIFGVDEMMVQ